MPIDESRKFAVETLLLAVAACDPADAREVLSSALFALNDNTPEQSLFEEDLEVDAGYWATVASQSELSAYLGKILEELNDRKLSRTTSIRLAALAFSSLSLYDRGRAIKLAGPAISPARPPRNQPASGERGMGLGRGAREPSPSFQGRGV
jgi:hypothetical protein